MGSDNAPRKQSFWSSIPGVLTGVATVITAVGTLVTFVVGGGGGEDDKTVSTAENVAATSSLPTTTAPPPPTTTAPPPPTTTTTSARVIRVTGTTLRAEVPGDSGPCPFTITFRGTITVDGPGSVSYTFAKGGGGEEPQQLLTFEKAGTKEIVTAHTWTAASGKRVFGWWATRILEPAPQQDSAPANFSYTCA